jgi:hypothetical protein
VISSKALATAPLEAVGNVAPTGTGGHVDAQAPEQADWPLGSFTNTYSAPPEEPVR